MFLNKGVNFTDIYGQFICLFCTSMSKLNEEEMGLQIEWHLLHYQSVSITSRWQLCKIMVKLTFYLKLTEDDTDVVKRSSLSTTLLRRSAVALLSTQFSSLVSQVEIGSSRNALES